MLKRTSQNRTSRETDSLLTIAHVFADAWHRERAPRAGTWCEETLRLCDDVEAGSGPINLKERPYWRVVFDAFDDPFVESIVVKKSTQVGGTVTLWNHMLFKAVWNPAPCMVVLPDKESARE